MTVEIQFTNKSSFYIAVSSDLLFDHLLLIFLTLTQMALQINFTSDCSFYIKF